MLEEEEAAVGQLFGAVVRTWSRRAAGAEIAVARRPHLAPALSSALLFRDVMQGVVLCRLIVTVIVPEVVVSRRGV